MPTPVRSQHPSPAQSRAEGHLEALALLRRRRSQYVLGREAGPDPDAIDALIRAAIVEAPSPFNVQGSRAVVLFGVESEALWQIVSEVLEPIAPAETFEATRRKLASFAGGIGTVLFFEDLDTVDALTARFPLYADKMQRYSHESGGMAQYAVWLTLAAAGLGASLQHYNPLIDDRVRTRWLLPARWELRAQMPFGSHGAAFPARTCLDEAIRFRRFGQAGGS